MKEKKSDDMSMPLFERPFRTRVREGWENFLKDEAKLRQMIDKKADSERIMKQLDTLLSSVFKEVYAEVGFNGEKYDLILNLEGDWSRLFSLTYFKSHAPEEVLEHWNILVGRQARGEKLADYQLNIRGIIVCARDIQVWTEWTGSEAKVYIYCEKLISLLKEKEGEAYWIAYIMLDYAIGELAEMKYISELEVLSAPYEGRAMTLEELLPHFMDRLSFGKDELFNAERYCQLYCGYQMKPNEDADDGLRGDVFTGSTCFLSLLNEFFRAETRIMDTFHKDGIVAGYFCYPLYGFKGDDRGAQILDFRDNTADRIENLAGSDSFTYIGGATGIYYGYLDFIAWDLKSVVNAAISVFEKSDMDWVIFKSFRRDTDSITLYEKTDS